MERRWKSPKPPDPFSGLRSVQSFGNVLIKEYLSKLRVSIRRLRDVASRRQNLHIPNAAVVQIGFKNISNRPDLVTSVEPWQDASLTESLVSDVIYLVEQLLLLSLIGHGAEDRMLTPVVSCASEISTLLSFLLQKVTVIIEDCGIVQIGSVNNADFRGVFTPEHLPHGLEAVDSENMRRVPFPNVYELQMARCLVKDVIQVDENTLRFLLEGFKVIGNTLPSLLESCGVVTNAPPSLLESCVVMNAQFSLLESYWMVTDALFSLLESHGMVTDALFSLLENCRMFIDALLPNGRGAVADAPCSLSGYFGVVRNALVSVSEDCKTVRNVVRSVLENYKAVEVLHSVERGSKMVREVLFSEEGDLRIPGEACHIVLASRHVGMLRRCKVDDLKDEAHGKAEGGVRQVLHDIKQWCQNFLLCLKEKSEEVQADVHIISCQHVSIGLTNRMTIP